MSVDHRSTSLVGVGDSQLSVGRGVDGVVGGRLDVLGAADDGGGGGGGGSVGLVDNLLAGAGLQHGLLLVPRLAGDYTGTGTTV